ncbi:MAG: DUF192 domain-containing protein [Nitriliruptorales bacterium]
MLLRRALTALLTAVLVVGCTAGATSDGKAVPERVDSAPPAPAFEQVPPLHPSIDGYPNAMLRLVGPTGEAVTVAAKVADTASRRAHGLMEVPELPDGVGMLFVFRRERSSGFWMKDTLVPLDIAFVGPDGVLRRILRMEPCTGTRGWAFWRSLRCPVYDPAISYRYALEVPAGWFERVGVDTRWRLELPADLPAIP